MKRLSILLLSIIGFVSCAQDKIIPAEQLPQEIKVYLNTHFQNNPVLQATVDNEIFSKTYDVILKDNFNLEFDKNNKVKEIKGFSKLPDGVIPQPILEFVKAKYPTNSIIKWELDKDDHKQEVNLDNNITLEFDIRGHFLKID